jgi:hypothetical protein
MYSPQFVNLPTHLTQYVLRPRQARVVRLGDLHPFNALVQPLALPKKFLERHHRRLNGGGLLDAIGP